MASLSSLKSTFYSQPSVKSQPERMRVLQSAIDFTKDQATLIGKDLVRVRASDAISIIRKCVFEQIAELDASEFKMACEIKELKLVKLAFESISDAELGKVALTTLHAVVIKSLS